jgi:integrase
MERIPMATVRKRANKWQVQVRRFGFPNQSKTFHKRKDALGWARQIESKADINDLQTETIRLSDIRLSDLILRYLKDVVPLKKGSEVERLILEPILRLNLSNNSLEGISSEMFAAYRDERLRKVKPATVKRELGVLQQMLNIARTEWGIPLPNNPIELIQKPPSSRPRTRRLEQGEFEALETAAQHSKAYYLWPLVELAIQTGMRRGELLKAVWEDLDLQGRRLTLRDTKNGEDRTIPLTRRAVEILSKLPRLGSKIFPVSPVAVRQAWERLRRRAGLEDLRFHDLRHEAVSRFFEMGLSVPEVALISGHRDFRMLARYTHLRAEDVVGKLN